MTDSIQYGDSPLPPRLPVELACLLEEPFSARAGFFRQGLAAVVCVSSVPAADDKRVNLSLLLSPRLLSAAATEVEAQGYALELDVCLRLLRDPQPEVRASACQRLGHLGCDEAREPLLHAARTDGDEYVREAATAALDSLLIGGRLPADCFAGLELQLIRQPPHTVTELEVARTDSQGRARFSAVPADALCVLQLTASSQAALAAQDWKRFMDSLSHTLLCFDSDHAVRSRLGDGYVEVAPHRQLSGDSFDAVLQFASAAMRPANHSALRLRPLARLGQHIFYPNQNNLEAGRAIFERLPLGTYELLWRAEPAASDPQYALCAASAPPTPPSGRPQATCPPSVVVHPRDRRLLATLEPDHAGSVILTVATDSAELDTARVRYRLSGEEGSVQLTAVPGLAVWRAVRYLRQRFTPESALAVSLELVS